ncbi:MAG: metallophosphoesterase [Lachnospiraceae bacterium]|nr:metallophosphoesterase [Lachnospiraceae bacterium]
MSKKILVVSDSHGYNGNLLQALSHFGENGRELEMMIHLGDSQGTLEELEGFVDCPVKAVRGNCDYSSDLPFVDFVQIGEEKAMITHGHKYSCNYSPEMLVDTAKANGASIVMYGHTHIPVVASERGVTVLNPGSISQPRQQGRKPTYLVITLEEDGRKNFMVVEMG